MEIRKTIKVFLASSEELKNEREKFGNFIRQLDDIYLKRGIHVQLFVWEDMDPCYNNVRKQDEYNAWIRESHIFVCLFYTKAGQYTLEELDVATAENSKRKEPKLMIYCRDLQEGDVEMVDLVNFKRRLEQEYGHFWGHFPTTDKLHLDFVMFFMRTEEGQSDTLKVVNGNVMLDGLRVANMENLPFATDNEWYKDMKLRLESLSDEIVQLWEAKQQAPGVEQLCSLHQQKLNEYNTLKEKFNTLQQTLFDTAKRISEIQLEKVSSEMRRAITAFENGHIEAANTIIDGIEIEAEQHLKQLDRYRELIHQDIEALLLKAKTLIADLNIPIEQRITSVLATYQKADKWAEWSALTKEKYALLLEQYGEFLYNYAKYNQALSIFLRACRMNEELYGTGHAITATLYNNIGAIHHSLDNNSIALQYYKRALDIEVKELGPKHPKTATTYSNIGSVYRSLDKYDKALEFDLKALAIWEEVFGTESSNAATSYNNIGALYNKIGNNDKALENCQKASDIQIRLFGENHPETAFSYNSMSVIYDSLEDFAKALEYGFKELAIFERVYGTYHPLTAKSFNNIACVYSNQHRFSESLDYYKKALDIQVKVLGAEHRDVAATYIYIGIVYNNMGTVNNNIEDFIESAKNYISAFDILEKSYEKDATILNNKVGVKYDEPSEIVEIPESFRRALDYWENALNLKPDEIYKSYNTIGSVYFSLRKYAKAYEPFRRALIISKKVLGAEHPDTKTIESNIGRLMTQLAQRNK